VIFDNFF